MTREKCCQLLTESNMRVSSELWKLRVCPEDIPQAIKIYTDLVKELNEIVTVYNMENGKRGN